MNKLSGKVKCSCKYQAMSSNQNHLVSFNKLKRVVNAVNYLKMNPIIILTKIDSTFAIKTTLFPNTCDLFFLKDLSLQSKFLNLVALMNPWLPVKKQTPHIKNNAQKEIKNTCLSMFVANIRCSQMLDGPRFNKKKLIQASNFRQHLISLFE